MKDAKKAKHNKTTSILSLVSISLLCIVFYDTIGKQLMDQAGVFRSIVRRFSPDAEYYSYTAGVLTIFLIPVTIAYIISILWLRKKRGLTGTTRYLVIGAALVSYQILILGIAVYNNLV